MSNYSTARHSPLSVAMPPPLGRGLYIDPDRRALDDWLPRLQIAIGTTTVLVIVGGLVFGLMQ